jgi:hypothetical protein
VLNSKLESTLQTQCYEIDCVVLRSTLRNLEGTQLVA